MIKRFIKLVRLRLGRASATRQEEKGAGSPESSANELGAEEAAGSIGKAQRPARQTERSGVRDSSQSPNFQKSLRKTRRPKKKKWRIEDFPVEPVPGKVRFHDIDIPLSVMHAVADQNFRYCTPIQAESLPHLLEGKDLIGHANTGTGKTAVFLITILSRLLRNKYAETGKNEQALIIAPTRELVIQIAKDGRQLSKYTNIRIAAVYGGTDYQKQMDFVQKKRCDIIVATPGRLLDFCTKKVIELNRCNTLVIDEADRMLDMGFIPDVRRIVGRLPEKEERQTLLFSATITEEVKRLAYQWCTKPVSVSIEPEQVAVESVEQKVFLVTSEEKYPILYNLIKKNKDNRMAVFANQKVEAKKLHERLRRNGINCTLLTGDIPQDKRTKRLENFRSGRTQILVATDVAGRGIHIEGISHVINYTLPYEPEDYVHRIGRTGRAGAEGVSVSFACEEESFVIPEIEECLGRKLECSLPDEELLAPPPKGTVENKPVLEKVRSQSRRRPRRRKAGSYKTEKDK